MKRDGTPVTFAAVARAAKVSQWLVYAEGVREYIDSARIAQAAETRIEHTHGRSVSSSSIRTDLALVRQDNGRLRTELVRLRRALQDRLGAELESQSSQSLRQRIDELRAANTRLQTDNLELTKRLAEVTEEARLNEEDLAAARASLRKMLRNQQL